MMRIPHISKHIPSLPYKGRLRGVWRLRGVCSLGCVGAFILLLSSCSGELVSNKYCKLPARFAYEPVSAYATLYSSCESMGEWCTIRVSDDGTKFIFAKPTGKPDTPPITERDKQAGFYLGLSGLIIGRPNIPELDAHVPVVTCYDWACRNCYDDYGILKRMTLREGGEAYCSRCQRTYNLNNMGLVASGPEGNPLYRYRVYYGSNKLVVSNP